MGQWKAVRLKKDAPLELYDLPNDSTERINVAADNPEVVARIEQYLEDRADRVGALAGEVGFSALPDLPPVPGELRRPAGGDGDVRAGDVRAGDAVEDG